MEHYQQPLEDVQFTSEETQKKKNFLYTCGNSVFIRDLTDSMVCEQYSEHQHSPTVARYAPSGFYIASADASGLIRIWDTTQKTHICKLETRALGGPILDMAWSEDSKRVVAVGEGKEKYGSVFLWDSGSSVGEIQGHTKFIMSCDMRQQRPYRIVTGGEDLLVGWFEGPPFKVKKTLTDHTRFVNCVRFSPDGEKVITVAADKVGLILDGKTGEKIGTLDGADGHKMGINSVTFSPDNKFILTASSDKTCKLWDATTYKCLKTFEMGNTVEDQQLGVLWQGDNIISVALSGVISYLDLDNPSKPKKVIHGHNKPPSGGIVVDKANNAIFTVGTNAVRWDLKNGSSSSFQGQGPTSITCATLSGGDLVVGGSDDCLMINPISKNEFGNKVSIEGAATGVVAGKKDVGLVVACSRKVVVVLRNGKVVHTEKVSWEPQCVDMSVDNTHVAVGGADNSIHVFKISADKLSQEYELKWHRAPVSAVKYAPNGIHLASSDGTSRVVGVWDLNTKAMVQERWQFHTAKVVSIDWSSDSQRLVSGSLDSNVILWNMQNPTNYFLYKGAHWGGVFGVAFVDDQTIVSTGNDCTAKVFNVK